MSMRLHFLGTGCMVPTKERNHLSVALEREGEIFLFDCGEGTQRQAREKKLPFGKIKKIFISHWHGDHVLGLGGLIQTLANTDNVEKLEIHGPKGSQKFLDAVIASSIFEPQIEIKCHEHSPKKGEVLKILDNSEYEVYCTILNHSVPCLGYSLKEKNNINVDKEKAKKLGLENSPMLARAKMNLPIEVEGKTINPEEITYTKKGMQVSFVFDTRPCDEIDKLINGSDYLVMEATYIYEQHGEKAEEHEHMTAKETAEIASESNVENLVITHFSQRYKDTKEIEAEAKESFENTISTYDLMSLNLK